MIDYDKKVKQVHTLIMEHGPIVSSRIECEANIDGTNVRKIVRQLRRDGHIIVGSAVGYYETNNPEEVVKIVCDLQSRAKSIEETLTLLRENARKRFGYRIEEAIKSHSSRIQNAAEGTAVSNTRDSEKKIKFSQEKRCGVQSVQFDNRKQGSSADVGRCQAFSFDDLLRSVKDGE
jgi:predicted transcriptional regulator